MRPSPMSTISRSYRSTARSAFPGLDEPYEQQEASPIINKFVHSSADGTTSPCDTCTGSCQKFLKNCCTDHSVFVAIYAPDIITTGVAPFGRVTETLRKMGADAGFVIATLPDGELARRYRNDLPKELKQKPSLIDIVNSIRHRVSEQAYKGILAKYKQERIYRLRYAHDDTDLRPINIPSDGDEVTLRKIKFAKGSVMIIEKRDALYAVDLDSLVGRETGPGKGCVNLQTSLLQYATGGSLIFF